MGLTPAPGMGDVAKRRTQKILWKKTRRHAPELGSFPAWWRIYVMLHPQYWASLR